MKKIYLLSVIASLLFGACSKEKVEVEKVSSINKNMLSMGVYPGGSATITKLPDGRFKANWGGAEMLFNYILYREGPYQKGDAVPGYNFITTDGNSVDLSQGGNFTIRINKLASSDAANARAKIKAYNDAFNAFITGKKNPDGTLAQPDYPSYSNIVNVLGGSDPYSSVVSGVVIRDPSSPSTFSIAEAAYPVRPIVSNPGKAIRAGYVKNGADYYYVYLPDNYSSSSRGDVVAVTGAFTDDYGNNNKNTVSYVTGTWTKVNSSQPGYLPTINLDMYIHMKNNTQIYKKEALKYFE
ncbi:MAG: hypothetical protein INR69_14880 [Mucilaginibacter polytrichastri]|nr:hypothetical protein [Mucilaginibacter polytrichastri]